ncbi:protein YhjJ [Klebsiella michiganensis]|uniref:Protein YhjJ n=1 Tax=Klebsiella michiganensis TaxID=1134687 RepID=A0A7H4PFW0_9ENTR|nr:protein YhjJ [Klebsiella michiganensis]
MDIAQLKEYYHKWYTPDAMTLIVVGNVDSRSVAEQINKTFGGLKGKRETPGGGSYAVAAADDAGQHHDRCGAPG